MIKNSYVVYELDGLNFSKFLSKVRQQNIEVLSLDRLEYNKYKIKIFNKDKIIFEKTAKTFNYKFSVIKTSKILSLLKVIKKNIALFLCALILTFGIGIVNNIVLKVEVFGLESLTQQQIEDVLNSNGITKGRFKSSYDLDAIELLLKNSLEQISLVSAVVRGNTILVNINEKIDNSVYEGELTPLVAPFDMVIKDVRLKSGTCVVDKNTTVKQGDVIVLPYIEYKDGTKLEVMAQAEIDAYVEVSNTIYYMENHEEFVKSGRTQKATEFIIFNLNWSGKNITPNFKNFETQVVEEYVFKNMLLPIKKTTHIYYELVPKQVFVPFNDSQEQKLICENETLLYNKLCSKLNVTEYEYLSTTKSVENMYLVTTYLKANITF